MKTGFLSLSLLALAGVAVAQSTYTIDNSHSSAQFSVRHMMMSNVRGEFSSVNGTLVYDPKNPSASKIEAVIDVNSINTREPKRDAHLKSADFFDVAKFPTLTFKSTQVWKEGAGLKAKGSLTMHGVTREVVLNVEGPTAEAKDPWGNQRIGVSATTKLNRKDWGLVWNQALEAGGVLVGEEVQITIDVEAVKNTATTQVSKALTQ